MRILEGKYRRRPLQSTLSPKVRPTARRMREALFDFLGQYVEGAYFLDLCAGSGAVGIEALSRGAAHAAFVDRSLRMCHVIERNLEQCGVPEGQALVINCDVIDFLRRGLRRRGRPPWDIIFFDPPYAVDYVPVLECFAERAIMGPDGILAAEHHCKTQLPDEVGRLRLLHAFIQGESCLSFYERQ